MGFLHMLLVGALQLACTDGFWSRLPRARPVTTPRLCNQTTEYCFSYDRTSVIGPSQWDKVCDTGFCFYGDNQSPISIDPNRVEGQCDPSNRLGYNFISVGGRLENDGYYPKLTSEDGDLRKAVLRGVPGIDWTSTYRLDSLHIHFGRNGDRRGSEHGVRGRRYDGELHLVHEREGPEGGVTHEAGQAVVGVFLSLREGRRSRELDRILDAVKDCRAYEVTENKTICRETTCPTFSYSARMTCPHWRSGECGNKRINVIPELMLPETRDFYYYYGSLTTPTLSESVLWQVMTTPLRITPKQLQLLRELGVQVPGIRPKHPHLKTRKPPPCTTA